MPFFEYSSRETDHLSARGRRPGITFRKAGQNKGSAGKREPS